jgi:hypothetical protein
MSTQKTEFIDLHAALYAKTREIATLVADDLGLDYDALDDHQETRLIDLVEALIETWGDEQEDIETWDDEQEDIEPSHPDRGPLGVLLAERHEIEQQIFNRHRAENRPPAHR